jgi:hypothetical protein
MVPWSIGAKTVFSLLTKHGDKSSDGFLVLWLLGWTFCGCYVVLTILWQLFGQELIIVEPGQLTHRIQLLGIARNRAFASNQVTRLRAIDSTASERRRQAAWNSPFFGRAVGTIAFDYGARTIRIAPSLDAAEGWQLIAKLKDLLPATTYEGTNF